MAHARPASNIALYPANMTLLRVYSSGALPAEEDGAEEGALRPLLLPDVMALLTTDDSVTRRTLGTPLAPTAAALLLRAPGERPTNANNSDKTMNAMCVYNEGMWCNTRPSEQCSPW